MIRNRIAPLDYDPGSVVYEHVRRLVNALCRRAVRMGYDWVEVESAANLGFTIALESYTPACGEFVPWVKTKVRYAILDIKRRNKRKPLPLASDPDLFDPADDSTEDLPEFDLVGALLGLSDDAKAWITLVVDSPDRVKLLAAELGWSGGTVNRGAEAVAYRQAVYTFLREAGWSNRRIDRAYMEACASFAAD